MSRTLSDAPTTEPAAAPYENLRQRHLQDMRARIPVLLERLAWRDQRLKAWRQARLREVIRYAKTHSAWHERRLTHIDPDTVTEAALPDMPPMTKDELMANFDEIVTDPRVTLERVESHLAGLASDAYLFDRYHVNASGGSTGAAVSACTIGLAGRKAGRASCAG